jgi:hypothetical protein
MVLLPKGYDLVIEPDNLSFFLLPADPKCHGRVPHSFLALWAIGVYMAMMTVIAWADELAQALDTLNRQLGMGVFKMGRICKAAMHKLNGVQALLQFHHEPFIFVHASPLLTFNILYLKCHTVQYAESSEPI